MVTSSVHGSSCWNRPEKKPYQAVDRPEASHDDNGNRLTWSRISTDPADDYVTEYAWDHRNRLTKITFKNHALTVTKTVEYRYDHQDRLLRRVMARNAANDFQLYAFGRVEQAKMGSNGVPLAPPVPGAGLTGYPCRGRSRLWHTD
jgi:hypothetical protein